MYHKSRRHGPKSGHSYYLERKELVSIEDGGNVYIKNTQTHVRELYRQHFPIEPEDIVSSSKSDMKILETARQVKKLNTKIGDEIDKFKSYRDYILQEQAKRQRKAKELHKTTKSTAITQGETAVKHKDRKSRKFSSPNSRTVRVSSATRSENSQSTPRPESGEQPRESGGCSYGYNESMSFQNSVYQVDYDPGVGMSCQCPTYCYPGSCPCYGYATVMPDYCSPNPYSQYPLGGVYQQQTAFARSCCTCPCVTCSRRATDLNTEEYLRDLRPSPQASPSPAAPRRTPSPEPKKKKKTTPQYPTAKSPRNEKRAMKVSVKKPSEEKTKEQPKRAAERKVIPKKETKTKAKKPSEESEENELEMLRLHRQYMEMYKKEHEKTAKKESSAHSSDLEPHPTFTKLSDGSKKLKNVLKPEPLSFTETLEAPQEVDSKDLGVKQSPSLLEAVEATEEPPLATQPEKGENPSLDPLLCDQSCQTDIKSTSELELELKQFRSSPQEIPTQTDQEFYPRDVMEQEEYIECHTVCVTKKVESIEVVYESPIERKHQSEPMLRSNSTIIAEFPSVADPVPVTHEPSAIWEAPTPSRQSETQEVYSFPENTQLSLMTESPRSNVNESEDRNATVVSEYVSEPTTLKLSEGSAPIDASPIDTRSPTASQRTLYPSEDNSPTNGHRLDYRKQQVFYAPTYHRSEPEIAEQLYVRKTQVFYTPTPSCGINQRTEESAPNYSFSLESRAFHSSVGSSSDYSLNLYAQMKPGGVFTPDSNRTSTCLEQCSPDCSQQQYSLKDHVFYTPAPSNRTFRQSEHSSPDLSASERTFDQSEEKTCDFRQSEERSYRYNTPRREIGYKPDSSSLTKTIVCEKRTRSVKFEDESGPSSRVHSMRSCLSRSHWEGVHGSEGDKSYREFDRDDSSVLRDSCRTSSSADCTCVESNNEENYESCDESKTVHFPPFSACPCMRDYYTNLAALCKPINP